MRSCSTATLLNGLFEKRPVATCGYNFIIHGRNMPMATRSAAETCAVVCSCFRYDQHSNYLSRDPTQRSNVIGDRSADHTGKQMTSLAAERSMDHIRNNAGLYMQDCGTCLWKAVTCERFYVQTRNGLLKIHRLNLRIIT
jgi:hypothetical protein